jgi:hypothetical protein
MYYTVYNPQAKGRLNRRLKRRLTRPFSTPTDTPTPTVMPPLPTPTPMDIPTDTTVSWIEINQCHIKKQLFDCISSNYILYHSTH